MNAYLIAVGASMIAFYLGVAVGKRSAAQRIVDAVLARETRLESLAESSGVLEPESRPSAASGASGRQYGAALGLTDAEVLQAERRERGW